MSKDGNEREGDGLSATAQFVLFFVVVGLSAVCAIALMEQVFPLLP